MTFCTPFATRAMAFALPVAFALLPLVAAAQSQGATAEKPRRSIYGGVLGHFVIPDGDRDGDEGYGAQFLLGFPMNPTIDLELSGGGHYLHRQSDRQYDVFYSLGVDAKYNFGSVVSDAVLPFVLTGVGATREDFINDQEVRPYLDFGVGATFALPVDNLSLRAESRYHLVRADGDEVQNGKRNDTFSDVLFNVGLQFDLTDSVRGARDTDDDGVTDRRDRCPNTPAGTAVDGRGCTLDLPPADSDGDGITDAADRCPGTPPGAAVDAIGCLVEVPAAPLPPPLAPVLPPMDTDGDGVTDTSDACPDTARGLRVDAFGCVIAQTTVLQGVQFESGSSRLTSGAQELLASVAATLKAQPDLKLEISGHTDSLGPQALNLTLSLDRAKAVRNYLVSRGVDDLRLQAEGYGEFVPVETNETESGRAKNRRVEFKVVAGTGAVSPATTMPGASVMPAPAMEPAPAPEPMAPAAAAPAPEATLAPALMEALLREALATDAAAQAAAAAATTTPTTEPAATPPAP